MSWGAALSAVLQSVEASGGDYPGERPRAHVRGAALVQDAVALCGPGTADAACSSENFHIICLSLLLCACITAVICALSFVREDKDDMLTPLCPQLIVKTPALKFQLPWVDGEDYVDVLDLDEKPICKVSIDYPDPTRPGFFGVAATVRLLSNSDLVLASVVARAVAVSGQGLALCRAGCEIFGFVEPDPRNPRRYIVRHRTRVELFRMQGDFDSPNLTVTFFNPVGLEVCNLRCVGDACYGQVMQNVDAGLVLTCLFAVRVDRHLATRTSAQLPEHPWDSSPRLPDGSDYATGNDRPVPAGTGTYSGANLHMSDEDRGSVVMESDATSDTLQVVSPRTPPEGKP